MDRCGGAGKPLSDLGGLFMFLGVREEVQSQMLHFLQSQVKVPEERVGWLGGDERIGAREWSLRETERAWRGRYDYWWIELKLVAVL